MGDLKDIFSRYRPRWHFSASEGWLNDPNGLIRIDDLYHMYYQYYPYDMIHGPMHWGHAVSSDLIFWEYYPTVLHPDALGEIYSGCTFFDKEGQLYACYTQHLEKDGDVKEVQSLAMSTDNGYTYKPLEINPVLTEKRKDFRDPRIFFDQKSDTFIMILACGLEIRFYRMETLERWIYTGSFTTANIQGETVWECPDLLRFNTKDGICKDVLVFSVSKNELGQEGVVYFTGEFTGETFLADDDKNAQWFDFGTDYYAMSTFGHVTDRIIAIAWMNNWCYAEKIPAVDFRGNMTIPREITICRKEFGYQLLQYPVREFWRLLDKKNETSKNGIYRIPEKPVAIELEVYEDKDFLLSICNEKREIIIQYISAEKTISIDRSSFKNQFLTEEMMIVRQKLNDYPRKLLLILDVNSMELFINGGLQAATMLCFWETPYTYLKCSDNTAAVYYYTEKIL